MTIIRCRIVSVQWIYLIFLAEKTVKIFRNLSVIISVFYESACSVAHDYHVIK